MKKILCLIDSLGFGIGDSRNVFSGGAERQMAGLGGLLHKKGVNVTLATYHPHNCSDLVFEKYGLRTKYIKSGTTFYTKFLAVEQFLRIEQFDVVIAYKDGPCMIACICKLLGYKFKLIVSERNSTQNLSFRDRLKFLLYRQSDFIVPNSNTQGMFIMGHYHCLANKVNVITNFVDTKQFSPKKQTIDTNKISDGIRILVVGRINPQKNIERFIRVASRLKKENVRVTIDWYGGVHSNVGKYAESITQQYNEADVYDILSFKDDTSEIDKVYKQYDLFCLPSLYEGFPNVICEAMSSGMPILCSKVCDNPTIVKEGINGFLFDPLNEEDMYATILKAILMDKSQLNSIGEINRTTALNSFSEEVFVRKYLQLINKLDDTQD